MGQAGHPPPCEGGPSDLSWDGDDGVSREQRWGVEVSLL